MTKPNILAIIPARRDSKRLVGKNWRPFNGKPLIAWTIEQAQKSKLIDKLAVSTNDEAIIKISKRHGVEVLARLEELARDDSSIYDTIFDILDSGRFNQEIFILLQATSPLRKPDDIDNAINLFLGENADSLISVGEIPFNRLSWAIKKKGEYIEPYLGKIKEQPYFPYGGIYISKVETLRKHKSFFQEKTIPYVVGRWQHYDIDTIYDLLCAERISKYKQ